jgi:hypothetical protein
MPPKRSSSPTEASSTRSINPLAGQPRRAETGELEVTRGGARDGESQIAIPRRRPGGSGSFPIIQFQEDGPCDADLGLIDARTLMRTEILSERPFEDKTLGRAEGRLTLVI